MTQNSWRAYARERMVDEQDIVMFFIPPPEFLEEPFFKGE